VEAGKSQLHSKYKLYQFEFEINIVYTDLMIFKVVVVKAEDD
jgi:hypothetical protein